MGSRIALALILAVTFSAPTMAQPCNPVIDGTYCATQANPRIDYSIPTTNPYPPIQGMGGAFGGEQPGTLGAITFRGGNETCIGLMFRSTCN
jgi:hypothetical protein